jgi:diguanylate cyclase (GGDEF)-like protein
LATGQFEWHPETHLLTTLWCMGGVTAYVLALGDIAFIRIRQLRQARHENNQAAAALGEANASLQQQLDEINSLQVKLREQVLRDPLTGQYNRRYLDATLERELLRCQRQHCHVALLMIDIDHFKRINDNFGHQAGDEVLRQMGFMLGAHARSHDVVCRYGGEEFLIVLPELPVDAAHQRAEQIRLAVGNQHFQTAAGTLRLTLSVGVAAFPLHGHTVDALLHSADTALYAAKHQGRNRVVVSGAAG